MSHQHLKPKLADLCAVSRKLLGLSKASLHEVEQIMGTDHFGYMVSAFTITQAQFQCSLIVLTESGQYRGTIPIIRTMLEGAATLLWVTYDPDPNMIKNRALEWRKWALKEDRERLERLRLKNPEIYKRQMKELDSLCSECLDLAEIERLEKTTQIAKWLKKNVYERFDQIEADKKKEEKMYPMYQYFSSHLHWTPNGTKIDNQNSLELLAVVAVCEGFTCLRVCLAKFIQHFGIDITAEFGKVDREFKKLAGLPGK